VALSIGELAALAGVRTSTLRYYEDQGLLTPAGRIGGRRSYGESALTQLRVIQLCKAMGFDLTEIHALLTRTDDPSGYAQLARRKLDELKQTRRALKVMEQLLHHALECGCSGPQECARATVPSPALPSWTRSGATRVDTGSNGSGG
jgi:DNA-binding transcriptional MerR regulator